MTYAYQKARQELDSDLGKLTLAATRLAVSHWKLAASFSAADVIREACSIRGCVDAWDVLNSLDLLAEEGVVRWLNEADEPAGQNRRYERLK